MKFAVKYLSVLVAAGLVMGATEATAGGKKAEDQDLIKLIDADLKRIDKDLQSLFKVDSKK